MSELETQHVLDRAGSVANVSDNRGRRTQTATRYLRPNERANRERELKRLKDMLTPSAIEVNRLGPEAIKQAQRHRISLEHDLEDHTPPKVAGDTKDAIHREIGRLEEKIKVGMLTQQEMRRNAPGAVDRHLKWEKANKADILKLKNLYLLRDPDSDEQDVANIEKLRPYGNDQAYHTNAQIPGHFAMTAQAKANWPEGMTEVAEGSPLAQAERRELEELRARLAALEQAQNTPKAKTAAQIAASERMKKRWAAKKGLTNA